MDNELTFRQIVDGISALVGVLAPDGQLELVNQQTLDYFGKSLAELKYWETSDAIHPDDRPDVIAAWRHALELGEPCDFEHRIRRADGVYRWFHGHGLPVRDPRGRIERWCLLLTDVDERRRAETRLAGEKQLLEMVASGSPLTTVLDAICTFVEGTATNCHCSVYLIDPKGPTFHNGAAPTLPASFNDPIDGVPVSCETGPCGMAATMKTQVIVSDVASDPLMAATRFRPLALAHGLRSCWSTPIVSLTGDVLGTFAIYQRQPASPTPLQQDLIEQVTHIASIAIERAQSETALGNVRSELARVARVTTLGALTASIAHEVNQPLSGIITNAGTCLRMLATDPPDVDGARETAKRAIRDGNRAADVVARLRSMFIKQGATSESLDLNDATREVLALSSHELQRGRVVVRAELAADLPRVRGDRVQLQQVVLNLVLNAAEAMSSVEDRARLLVIRTEPDDDDCVRLSVTDAGIGLDPANRERLFDAFYTTKVGGMGIGLSVSRSIIESHHGRLWAAPNEGPGATFALSVPRVALAIEGPATGGAVTVS